MNLRVLRYFVAVAAERNFNRAAEKLNMAQPPLSRAVQQLETEIGAALIDRSERPLKLTAVGHLFLEQAVQVLARVDGMRTMVQASVSSERRRYTIGFVASTIYARLPEIIRAFRIAAPDIDLVLVENTTLEQVAALKEGKIDVGFGRIRFEDDAVQRIILRDEPLVVALPTSSKLAQTAGPISMQALADEPLIVYPRSPRPSYADQVLSFFRDHAVVPKIAHEARELQIAIGLVAAEEGIAIVPVSVSRSRTHDVIYRELKETATSPIIMSRRVGDVSAESLLMGNVIAQKYREWDYAFPDALVHAGSGFLPDTTQ